MSPKKLLENNSVINNSSHWDPPSMPLIVLNLKSIPLALPKWTLLQMSLLLQMRPCKNASFDFTEDFHKPSKWGERGGIKCHFMPSEAVLSMMIVCS